MTTENPFDGCHRHGKNERRRSSSLAGRRSDPHRRALSSQARRTPAVELATTSRERSAGGLTPPAIKSTG